MEGLGKDQSDKFSYVSCLSFSSTVFPVFLKGNSKRHH